MAMNMNDIINVFSGTQREDDNVFLFSLAIPSGTLAVSFAEEPNHVSLRLTCSLTLLRSTQQAPTLPRIRQLPCSIFCTSHAFSCPHAYTSLHLTPIILHLANLNFNGRRTPIHFITQIMLTITIQMKNVP